MHVFITVWHRTSPLKTSSPAQSGDGFVTTCVRFYRFPFLPDIGFVTTYVWFYHNLLQFVTTYVFFYDSLTQEVPETSLNEDLLSTSIRWSICNNKCLFLSQFLFLYDCCVIALVELFWCCELTPRGWILSCTHPQGTDVAVTTKSIGQGSYSYPGNQSASLATFNITLIPTR